MKSRIFVQPAAKSLIAFLASAVMLASATVAMSASSDPPLRNMRVVYGSSVDITGTDLCSSGSGNSAQQSYASRFDTGSSGERYMFFAAPTTASRAITVSLSANAPIFLRLYDPAGVLAISGYADSLSYYRPDARVGSYMLVIGGPRKSSGADCGFRQSQSLVAQSVIWTGTLTYTPLAALERGPARRNVPPCLRPAGRFRPFDCN